ncbi:MAG: YceI family protein [Bacteroidota bacterium]|nr:YceI family protein [Bacteroidota bacterium]
MKKYIPIAIIAFMLLAINSYSQKYKTNAGHLKFHSKTNTKEIDCECDQTTCSIDFATGEVVANCKIKCFKCDNPLVEEHINQNYVESNKYPDAEYKGMIVDVSSINLKKDGIYNVTTEGEFTLHGVTNNLKVSVIVEIKEGKVYAKSKFFINPFDYNIKISASIRDKIEKNITVLVDCELKN